MADYWDILWHGIVKPEFRNFIGSSPNHVDWSRLDDVDFVREFLDNSTTTVLPRNTEISAGKLSEDFNTFYNKSTGEWQYTYCLRDNRTFDIMAFEKYILPNVFENVLAWELIHDTVNYTIWKDRYDKGVRYDWRHD